MKKSSALLLVSLTLISSPGLCDSELSQLAKMISGTFDTHAANPGLPSDQRLVDKRVQVYAPQLGEFVFYQQINQHADLNVYRQRVLVLGVSAASGQIEQRAYKLREPEWYVDADSSAFDGINMDRLDAFMHDGCEQVWTRTADGFRGYVDPKRCQIISSRTGKARAIESENYVTPDSITLVERGYDPETGEQLFGSPQGESMRLGRVD